MMLTLLKFCVLRLSALRVLLLAVVALIGPQLIMSMEFAKALSGLMTVPERLHVDCRLHNDLMLWRWFVNIAVGNSFV